ncbi:ferritin-like domain-containing protein [Campylobacter sp.]|uniref:ferritin-like domain-containing protein n=1 Tax=Campylobacter sp. TaxID=205 RepID=UPI003608441C
MRFFDQIWEILECGDKELKFDKFKQFYAEYKAGKFDAQIEEGGKFDEIKPLRRPSYAAFCEVVAMREIGGKKQAEKQKAFLHSIVHIEYSAVDIALDAAYRFRALPKAYYDDWLEVVEDEIRHFKMIEEHMAKFGVKYGEFTVHDGLFIALQNTSSSLLERMAVLPRYMEANGLDANAFMLKKLETEREKDESKARLCEILQVILDEEISHVSKGNRWFKFACEKEGVSPEIYSQIVQKIYPKAFLQSRELNVSARLKSGFNEAEIEHIKNIAKAGKAE